MNSRTLTQTNGHGLPVQAPAQPPEDWEVLGDTFETMGKIGIAMTVGFTAAALFCRWADQKKLKVPAAKDVLPHLMES